MCRLSGSSSSETGPSVSQVMSSLASEVSGFSGESSVGENKSIMFKTYRGPLPMHPRWYELPLGTCRSCDLSVAPSCGEEHNARDAIRLCKDTIREDAMDFGDPAARAPTQLNLKIAARVAA